MRIDMQQLTRTYVATEAARLERVTLGSRGSSLTVEVSIVLTLT